MPNIDKYSNKIISSMIIILVISFLSLSCSRANLRKRAKMFNELGITCLEQELYQDSVFWFEKVLELEKSNESALNNLAIAFSGLGMYDKALELYEKAYEISQNHKIQENMDQIKRLIE